MSFDAQLTQICSGDVRGSNCPRNCPRIAWKIYGGYFLVGDFFQGGLSRRIFRRNCPGAECPGMDRIRSL